MKPREIIVLFGLNGRDALLTDRERERAYREGEKRILEVVNQEDILLERCQRYY